MTEQVARYLQMFDLQPGASLDEVNTVYFTFVEELAKNPTEEDEARLQELRRAYDILRRAYVPPKKKAVEVLFDRRLIVPLLSVAVAALLIVLTYLNWGTIRIKMTHYEPGAELRLASAPAPFGTVVGYEAEHRFPAGAPVAAYEIRLDGKQETVWVSERTVVNGMTPVAK
jgi:hypothetical protein